MKGLKKIVRRKLVWLAAAMMALILLVAVHFQFIATQKQARDNAEAMFLQVRQIIRESASELVAVETEYRKTCLLNAEVISYIIRHNPDILGNVEEFRQLAVKLEVGEIHIFDPNGIIISGTHPEYFGMSFDSGEQISFFKPMIEDKTLRLCQEITPNTAEGVLVQYSAIWSSDQSFIVQVGMYPDAVLDATEKSELSYIFSLLRGDPGVALYAVSSDDGEIIGSTSGADNGKNIADIGISLSNMERYKRGAHLTVKGVNSYCVFTEIDGTLIGYVISNDQMYQNISSYTLLLAVCLFLIAVVLVLVVTQYTDRYILHSIAITNDRLRAVTEGDLEGRVDVQTSREFSELSHHINSMIGSLLSETEKINLVLNRTNLHIGVYEYSTKMRSVRYTEHIPEIFGVSEAQMAQMATDYRLVQAFVEKLRCDPIAGAENVYRYVGQTERYLRLEEVYHDNTTIGIAVDMTEETVSRMRAEAERDMDLMTGLYNRRGIERQFARLFAKPHEMGRGVLVMMDSDNLKLINDTYGHAVGDLYLKRLAEVLERIEAPGKLVARTGGDEFVLLMYGYADDEAAEAAVSQIRDKQDRTRVLLPGGEMYPLYFSYGHELTRGRSDYERMLSLADTRMYESKRARKKAFREKLAHEHVGDT